MIDISLGNNPARLCNGLSRRSFLRVGGLGVTGLSLASMLRLESAARASTPGGANVPAIGVKSRAKSVLLVFLGGGLSHHDTFDLKPDAVSEIRGKYTGISTNLTGLRIGELLPRMARTMDKVCLVRSQAHENDHHETATNWVLSGRFGSAFGDYPSMGAVIAHESGFSGILPPYVAVPKNPSFTWELGKSAYLGGRYESFKAGNPNEKGFKVRDLGLAQPMAPKMVDRRKSLLAAVDTLGARVKGNDQMATYDEFQQRAADMITSPEAQSAFDIEQESVELRDAYGRTEFGQGCLLARRLLERGVRFAQVNFQGWDHHGKIYQGLEKRVPDLDQGLSTLLNDMSARGILDETLVVVMGEFGRTPKINKDAGRDHWGRAGSMLFAGAGVRGGTIVGKTDRDGAYVTDTPIRPADVCYTIYEALGINPRKELLTPEGRPVEILSEGGLIKQLYA